MPFTSASVCLPPLNVVETYRYAPSSFGSAAKALAVIIAISPNAHTQVFKNFIESSDSFYWCLDDFKPRYDSHRPVSFQDGGLPDVRLSSGEACPKISAVDERSLRRKK